MIIALGRAKVQRNSACIEYRFAHIGVAGPTQNITKDRQEKWEELKNGPKKV
jgi:hypothetical protein